MKKFGFIALIGVMTTAANAQFSLGNLVVLRAGDGTAALSGSATAIFIDQYTTAGASVSSTAIATSGANQMTMSGSATAEGGLSIVYFGGAAANVANWGVSFGGYNATTGVATIASSTTATALRRGGVLRFDTLAGTHSATDLTAATNPFNAQGIRGLAYDGVNNKFAAVGSGGGVLQASGAGASTFVSTTTTNNRRVQILNNDIFYSTGSGTTGVYMTPGGMGGGGPITSVLLQGAGASQSINDFHIFRSTPGTPTGIMYANDTGAATGGLYFNGVWDSLANGGLGGFTGSATQIVTIAAINTGTGLTTITGLRDFAVVDNDVYATTSVSSGLNHIVKISYGSGFAAPNTGISLVATAGTNTAFRGIEVVPEPATFAALGLGLVALVARRRRSK